MEEIEKTETQEKPEDSTENSNEGGKPKELGPIERANIERKKLDETLEKVATEREKLEKLEVNKKLGGGTEGATPVEEKKKETPKDYAEKVMNNDL